MSCRDYERLWNELLDARGAPAPALDRALEEHASACPTCRAVSARYQMLRQALRAWGPPSPPADLADRVLAAHAGEQRRNILTLVRFRPVLRLAAAAALLVAAVLGLRPALRSPTPPAPTPEVAAAPRPLAEALAEATSATLDLARQTSAPAARLGRRVLETASVADAEFPVPVEVRPASDVLQSVGDRVNAGVRPLSGTARKAFSFLLPPSLDAATTSPRPGA
jgi:hypothetical protein